MDSTLTQISNVFNLLAQADPRVLNYKFDWRQGVNRNKVNNFNPTNSTGTLYPSIMMEPPDSINDTNEPQYLEREEDIDVVLYFDDLQDKENDGSANTLNLIEQWDNLHAIAKDFMANFVVLSGVDKYNIGEIVGNVRYVPRSNLGNDKLITWEATFQFRHRTPCTDPIYQIDPTDLTKFPENIQETDIERVF